MEPTDRRVPVEIIDGRVYINAEDIIQWFRDRGVYIMARPEPATELGAAIELGKVLAHYTLLADLAGAVSETLAANPMITPPGWREG